MDIKPLTSQSAALWDEFCLSNADAWFWHTTPFFKYQELYRPAAKTDPRHFFIERDGRIIAICPLALEKQTIHAQEYSTFSLGQNYLPAPVIADSLSPSDRERVTKTVFQEIDRLARGLQATKVIVEESPLTPRFLFPHAAPANPALAYGFLDTSLRTQIIDLREAESKLWSNVRQAYRSLIHRAEEAFQYRLVDESTVTPDLFKTYQALHLKASGRVTRPQITFDIMQQWVRDGRAFLAQAFSADRVVASALITTYKQRAYYLSGCNDPELDTEWALSHFLQWKSLLALQRRGLTHYEIGLQFNDPSLAQPASEKELRIAFFKRGMGGFPVPWHRAEKFYDADLFALEYADRLAQAKSAIQEQVTRPA